MKGKTELTTLLILGILLLCLLWFFTRQHSKTLEAISQVPVRPVAPPDATDADDGASASLNKTRPAGSAAALAGKLTSRLTRPGVRAHEAVLVFKDADGYRRFLARAAQTGAEVTGKIDPLAVVRVRVRAYDTFAGELLANAGDYGGVAANTFVETPPVPDDRTTHPQVPVRDGLLAALGVTTDTSAWGRGVTIAVLDGGVAPDATLSGGRLKYLDIGLGYSGAAEDSAHGTAVAALAAGTSADAQGVAPAAGILSIRVTSTDGKSDVFTITQAIVAAVDAGAQILNISLGGYATSEALDRAIRYAGDHGAIIVAAAGNDQASRLVWPAADPRVVSVGATDATGQQVSFSNSGPQLHLTAPGYGIQTAGLNGTRTLFSGTSASAPVVSGAIAAVMSETPGLTAAQAVQILQSHADDGGTAGTDPDYGNGVVDLGWVMARNDPARADTALSSYFYDIEASTLEVVVQNRGAASVTGLTLATDLNGVAGKYVLPALAPGASTSVKLPVDAARLTAEGRLLVHGQLLNPEGFTDQVPANNRKAVVLTAPGK
ncbi:MAG: S8 family serine peptidase [Verrucomicrobia bacterium]|nr:S8 family serine peptidase [Verrucomicrobiota bacterium]